MPTANMQIILQAVVAVQNNLAVDNPVISTFDFQNPIMFATQVAYEPYFQALTTGSQLELFRWTAIYGLFIQNLSPTNALTVTYITPATGGGPNNTATISDGGVLMIFDPEETGGGISNVLLTGLGATVPCFVLAAA
jgi:hypothetical protein